MRVFLVLCWLSLPVLAWAYHLGPGQTQVQLDQTGNLLRQASLATKQEDYATVTALLSDALAELPAEHIAEAQRIRLELAKAQMNSGQLPEARVALEGLLDELEADASTDDKLEAQTRTALANSQYYMTWLMRLEGLPAEQWEPEIEASRQNYRWLAEQAGAQGNHQGQAEATHDLEAAIRLARLDLDELQALKIPSQCQGCCSGQCKKPGRKQTKKKGEKKGAGSNLGPLPDGSGA